MLFSVLEQEYGVQAHYVMCDLRDYSENCFQQIFQDIKDLDVGVWSKFETIHSFFTNQ